MGKKTTCRDVRKKDHMQRCQKKRLTREETALKLSEGEEKRNTSTEQSEKAYTTLLDAPTDVLASIFSRLPLKDYSCTTWVSRGWRAFLKNSTFVKLKPFLLIKSSPSYYQLLAEERDTAFYDRLFGVTFTSSNNGIDHWVKFHDPPGTFVDIVGSCNGYLCLSLVETSGKYMIYNPINGESLELSKPTPYFEGLVLRGFGCCLESSLYKLICFSANNCEVLTVGDVNGWRRKDKYSEVFPARTCMESYHDGVFFQGSVHWVGQSIIVFHLAEETFQHLPLPYKIMDKGRVHCNLGILEDSLGLVVESGKDIEIYVMKDYDRAWQLTRVIKDVQFYLDTQVLKHGETGQLVILHRGQLQIIPPGTNDMHTVKICSATGTVEVTRVSAALVFFPTFVSFESAGLITTEQAENEGAHESAADEAEPDNRAAS